jgi:hypothetical protein
VNSFDVPGTPYAVYVGADGAVRAKGTVNTLEQLESVVVTGRLMKIAERFMGPPSGRLPL